MKINLLGPKKKGLLFMIIALVLGLLASLISVRIVVKRDASGVALPASKANIETKAVIVAAKDLPLGTVLAEKDLNIVNWPKGFTPQNSFSKREELIGKVVKSQIFSGETITAQRVAMEGSSSGLAVLIPPKMRAMTVAIEKEVGASGFIRSGSKVDIIATGRLKEEGRMTKVVLQGIEVLSAADEEGASSKSAAKTIITLGINPQDAEKLALALNEGKIYLIVRNLLDKEEVATPGVSTEELLKVKTLDGEKSPTSAKKVEIKVVELIIGENKKEEKFQR